MQKNKKSNEPNLRKSKKCPFYTIFGPVLPNLGQTEIFEKSDCIILNVLWYSIVIQKKNTKNDWTVQKI